MLKILIVEGNVKELREKAVREGSLAQSDLYEKTLHSLADDLDCSILYPTDADAVLPGPAEVTACDGIAWTGSALNIYDRSPVIERQIDFMKLCFEHETRIFGSCWGLQVAAVAAGGEVAANEKGREIGVARDIEITGQGLAHPMYKGKPPSFDAVAIHIDHIVELPEGAIVLSRNEMSEIQAVEIRRGRSVFWGVQYHPEFDLAYVSTLIKRYSASLVDEGIRENEADIERWAEDLATAQRDETALELRKSYCLDSDVLDPRHRLLELSNWLAYLRQKKASGGID